MRFSFDDISIDTRASTLRRDGELVSIEPQVFDFLVYLVENRGRLVTREEIVAEIWGGRIVSDAAVDSRVRDLRAAIGDSGQAQRYVKTVRGRGLRFEADVATHAIEPAPASQPTVPLETLPSLVGAADEDISQPSVCVLPFATVGTDPTTEALARAVPHDLVTGLARLRWLFVISRASSFQLAAERRDPFEAARTLGARYCLTGMVEVFAGRVTVGAELTDTDRGGVIWADRETAAADDIHALRERLVAAVIAAMEVRIPAHEAARAALKSPDRLDAWSAYHLGLRHMYRFNRADNAEAQRLFAIATTRDPSFCRAYAALACAHFQDAFVHFSGDVEAQRSAALDRAQMAASLDPLEPFAQYALGRALWLHDDLDGAREAISRCTDLNPNHAQAFYSGGLVDLLAGQTDTVQLRVDKALRLSPLDPMRYGMLMAQGLSLVAAGRFDEAAVWAGRSAREPNAHAIMELMTAMTYELSGNREKAEYWIRSAKRKNPGFGQADFFRSLNFRDERMVSLISGAFDSLGLE